MLPSFSIVLQVITHTYSCRCMLDLWTMRDMLAWKHLLVKTCRRTLTSFVCLFGKCSNPYDFNSMLHNKWNMYVTFFSIIFLSLLSLCFHDPLIFSQCPPIAPKTTIAPQAHSSATQGTVLSTLVNTALDHALTSRRHNKTAILDWWVYLSSRFGSAPLTMSMFLDQSGNLLLFLIVLDSIDKGRCGSMWQRSLAIEKSNNHFNPTTLKIGNESF